MEQLKNRKWFRLQPDKSGENSLPELPFRTNKQQHFDSPSIDQLLSRQVPAASSYHHFITSKKKIFYLMVAPHCVAESFICHDLRFPVQEGHETLLHCLQLLLVHLRKKIKIKELTMEVNVRRQTGTEVMGNRTKV